MYDRHNNLSIPCCNAEKNLLIRMREATCFCLHKKCNFSKLSRSLKVRKIEFVLKYLIDDYVNNLFFSSPQLLCVRKKYSNPYICQCVWCNYHIHSMAPYHSLIKSITVDHIIICKIL